MAGEAVIRSDIVTLYVMPADANPVMPKSNSNLMNSSRR